MHTTSDVRPAPATAAAPPIPGLAVLEERAVKFTYDPRTDTLSVIFKDDASVAESDEDKPGIVLDYDTEGNRVSLEILDASRRVTDARKVDYQIA
jgi:uncharacterized protein YuzE